MSRRTRFPFPRFCRLMKNRNGKKRTTPWDTNKENTECSSFCLRIQAFFFILTNTGTGKLNTDGLLRLQHKDLQIGSSRLQNYVRRSESRQALDLGLWEAYSPFALSRENLLVRGPVSLYLLIFFQIPCGVWELFPCKDEVESES